MTSGVISSRRSQQRADNLTVATSMYDWLDELPITPGPRHLRMGVRGLSDGPWLIRDELTDAELELKANLLAEHDSLVMLDEGFDDAAAELVSAMGIVADGPVIDRLEAACRLVPEDVLLMAQQDSKWELVGGWLVFPNQWTIEDKMGESLALIHDPIDGYEEMLRYKADTFFDRLGTTRIFWRRNWFFHDQPTFFQPEKLENRPMRSAEEASRLFIRSEYQTLRRLPETDVIVFTVKTQVAPIVEMRARSDLSGRVVEFLSSASDRSLANKDADGRHEAIIEYLSQ